MNQWFQRINCRGFLTIIFPHECKFTNFMNQNNWWEGFFPSDGLPDKSTLIIFLFAPSWLLELKQCGQKMGTAKIVWFLSLDLWLAWISMPNFLEFYVGYMTFQTLNHSEEPELMVALQSAANSGTSCWEFWYNVFVNSAPNQSFPCMMNRLLSTSLFITFTPITSAKKCSLMTW